MSPRRTTSLDAYLSILPQLNKMQRRVLELLVVHSGGLTDEEIQRKLDMNPNTERPRRGELEAKGLIRDSGRIRKTVSGRSAVVWEIVPPRRPQSRRVGLWD